MGWAGCGEGRGGERRGPGKKRRDDFFPGDMRLGLLDWDELMNRQKMTTPLAPGLSLHLLLTSTITCMVRIKYSSEFF